MEKTGNNEKSNENNSDFVAETLPPVCWLTVRVILLSVLEYCTK